MFYRLYAAFVAVGALLVVAAPVQAGILTINNVGSISDLSVLGAINTAITNVESLYSTGNGAGDVTLDVNFTYRSAGGTNLASSNQYFYGASYSNYKSALINDSNANLTNANLATAIANLASGNQGDMYLSYGQALLLSNYGLTTSASPSSSNDSININSSVSWNFTGTTSSTQYDAIGTIEHELDELLGIGGGGSFLGTNLQGNLGATDLYRYSAPGTKSMSQDSTYLSIDGGATNIVDFSSSGDAGDFGPACAPSSNNTGNDQYIQDAVNCPGSDEAYSMSSPEYLALTAIGWDPTQSTPVPEPGTLGLFGFGLVGLVWVRRRCRAAA